MSVAKVTVPSTQPIRAWAGLRAVAIVFALMLIAGSLLASQQTTQLEVGVRVLNGKGATVIATAADASLPMNHNSTSRQGVGAKDGRFRVPIKHAGVWDFEVRSSGRVPMVLRAPVLESLTLTSVSLPRDAGLEITIVNEHAEPLVGAQVLAQSIPAPPNAGLLWQPAATLGTAVAQGKATVACAAGGLAVVFATAEGYAEATSVAACGKLTLILAPAIRRPIIVVDPAGQPVADARVRAGIAEWLVGTTDLDGRLAVPVHPTAPTPLSVDSNDGLWARSELDEAKTRHRITLRSPRLIRGRVRGYDDRGVGEALVWAESEPQHAVRSDAAGNFVVPIHSDATPTMLQAVAAGLLPDRKPSATGGSITVLRLPQLIEIQGIVLDEDDLPVVSATLSFVALTDVGLGTRFPGLARASTVEDQLEGRFRTQLCSAVQYTVRVKRDGFLPVLFDASGSELGQDKLVIRLTRGKTATGRVVDSDGLSVAGATLRIAPAAIAGSLVRSTPHGPSAPSRLTTSEVDGSFAVANLPPGPLDIEVVADGFATVALAGMQPAVQDAQAVLGDIVLQPAAVLTGVIVTPSNEPLADATVSLIPRERGRPMTLAPLIEGTGANGAFRFDHLEEGETASLMIQHSDYPSQTVPPFVVSDDHMRIVLDGFAVIRGIVIDDGGAPVAGINVTAQVTTGNNPSHVSAEDGSFELEVASGVVGLQASRGAVFGPVLQELTVVPAEVVDGIRLTLPPSASLRGHVRAGNEFIADATILLSPQTALPLPVSTRTNRDGQLTFEQLDAGPMGITVRAKGFETFESEIVLDPGDNQVDIELASVNDEQEVSGQVIGNDGNGRGGVSVLLRPNQPTRQLIRTATAADGSFVFPNVADGNYAIKLKHSGLSPRPQPDYLAVDGVDLVGLELMATEGCTITGQVLGLDEDVRARSWVEASDGQTTTLQMATTSEGAFRFDHLPTGDWQLSGRTADRLATAQLTIDSARCDQVVDLRFDQGTGAIVGAATLDGRPGAGLVIEAVVGTGGHSHSTWTANDGSFAFSGLVEGYYELTVRAIGVGPVARRTVEVLGTTEVTIDIRQRSIEGHVVDRETDLPVAFASLAASVDRGDRKYVVSGSDGYFRFASVPDAIISLQVQATGYSPRVVQLGPGDPSEAQTIALEPYDLNDAPP